MIPESKLNILQDLVKTSSREELIWINGYLNALVSTAAEDGSSNGAPRSMKRMTVLYGTETGNSKKLALQLTASAKKNGQPVKCAAVEQYKLEDLEKEEYLFIVISTQGEGEPPITAKKFYDHIMEAALKLPSLQYAVLALGDSSYPLFCKTGIDIDERLALAGAKRVVPVRMLDVDFEEPASQWFTEVLSELQQSDKLIPIATATKEPAKKQIKKHFSGTIIKNINLNDRGSDRETYHIEIKATEEMDYEPGDSIAIIPSNRREVVVRIIELAGVDADLLANTGKYEGQVLDLLLNKLNICYLLGSTVKKYAALTGHIIPDMRLDLVDLLRIYPLKNASQFHEVLAMLNPIAPRLYSIASAPSSDPTEVHITVSRHRFLKEDEQQYGLCSSFLGDLHSGSTISFYIHRSRQFKLPALEKDIIMVGPGTGIASFRSFLMERDNTAATGRNWLFFGEKDFTTDFLYQQELQQFVQTGVLHQIDLSFTKNHTKKAYVEDNMKAQGEMLFRWLEAGAHFYLSGVKDPLTGKVEEALIGIIAKHGRRSMEEARIYFDNLKKEDRYHKDVY
jgi:sulfite reductase (NADPH) flavoprotein alpha-component